MTGRHPLQLVVNGQQYRREVEPRTLLVDFIRNDMQLTGTHVGCDTSQCGACTVHLDGKAVKSCTILALQAQGCSVTTIEGLANGEELHPLQAAFRECHALQCGYCTPGMIMAAAAFLAECPEPDEAGVVEALEGNLCRCTGYRPIIEATIKAAEVMR